MGRGDTMTGKAQSRRRGTEAARLQDLLHADAAAIMDDDLDDETLDEDVHRDESEDRRATSRPRSQVYSIRVPVERLEQVRRLAKERGVAPTAMLREWVLAQLDVATGADTGPVAAVAHRPMKPAAAQNGTSEQVPVAVATQLEATAAGLADVTAQLATTLARVAELVTAHNATTARPAAVLRALPPHHGFPAVASLYTLLSSGMPEEGWAATIPSGVSVPTDASTFLMVRHVYRGLAELRSTVENAAGWPGIGELDLGSFYTAADEELSLP